jgi:CubicO group peptidase (beta-lactamase class C family)
MNGKKLLAEGSQQRCRSPISKPAAGIVVLALILAVGCLGGGSMIHRTPHPDLDAETVDAFLAAVDDGRYGDLHSTLIIMDGVTVLEAYFDGHRSGERAPRYSVTKSFLSALIGLAIEDGAIPSVDEAIFVALPEFQGLALEDPRKLKITIGHLLSMTAGFEWDELSAPYGDRLHRMERQQRAVARVVALGFPPTGHQSVISRPDRGAATAQQDRTTR